MINKEIFELAEKLQNVVNEQMAAAKKALVNLPESKTKKSLEELLRKASSGNVSTQDAQRELEKIMKDAN